MQNFEKNPINFLIDLCRLLDRVTVKKKKKINILIFFYYLNIIIMYNILHIIKKFTTTMIG